MLERCNRVFGGFEIFFFFFEFLDICKQAVQNELGHISGSCYYVALLCDKVYKSYPIVLRMFSNAENEKSTGNRER